MHTGWIPLPKVISNHMVLNHQLLTEPMLEEMAKRKSPEDLRGLTEAMIPHAHRTAMTLARAGLADYDDCLQSNVILIHHRLEKYNPERTKIGVERYVKVNLKRDALSEYSRMHEAVGLKTRRSRATKKGANPLSPQEMDKQVADSRNTARRLHQGALSEALGKFIDQLCTQDQLVIRRLYGIGCDPTPTEALASELDISRMSLHKMEVRALERIRKMGAKEALKDFYSPEEGK